MANFFTRSYTKEGKGVSKDGQQKKPFFLFFEICSRKFWNIILVGLLFILFCIPVVTFGPACVAYPWFCGILPGRSILSYGLTSGAASRRTLNRGLRLVC